MKRVLLILAVILSSSYCASAQFGVMAGFTMPVNNSQANMAHQFHAGVTYLFNLPLGFGIQPSLMYNAKESSVNDIADVYKTGYLELPVQVQWGLGNPDIFRACIFVEPFAGLAVYRPDKEKLNMNAFEWGGNLGLGMVIFRHLELSVRYVWNIGKLADISHADLSGLSVSNANGVQLSTIVLF